MPSSLRHIHTPSRSIPNMIPEGGLQSHQAQHEGEALRDSHSLAGIALRKPSNFHDGRKTCFFPTDRGPCSLGWQRSVLAHTGTPVPHPRTQVPARCRCSVDEFAILVKCYQHWVHLERKRTGPVLQHPWPPEQKNQA